MFAHNKLVRSLTFLNPQLNPQKAILGISLGPILEESLFRGCLLPLLAQTTGRIPAVILTAFLFSVFHEPADMAHWVSFTATGLAYGWIRVVSGSTTAAAVMHATYNFVLCCSATV